MQRKIFIFGKIPKSDAALVKMLASGWEFELEIYPDVTPSVLSRSSPPVAVISYLSCNMEMMLDIFGNQPIGFGESVPLFQCVEGEAVPPYLYDLPLSGVFRSPLNETVALNMLLSVHRSGSLLEKHSVLTDEIMKYRRQKDQLVRIGTALSNENDLTALLEQILTVSREITFADAGSIYTKDKRVPGDDSSGNLRFRVAQNDSVKLKSVSEFTLPIDSETIAGYVACSGKTLTIDDVYEIGSNVPYKFGRDFDRKSGYRSKSMLTVPLKNMDGEVVGVLQLMNKKTSKDKVLSTAEDFEKSVIPFFMGDEDIILSIASYAAVSIERVILYENIKNLFEGFLRSSVAAIDERDRVTSGHSTRVRGYVKAFLDVVKEEPGCSFAELVSSEDRIRQFEFAAHLHDIGKIGVPEHLLNKDNRLAPGEMNAVFARLDYIELALEYTPESVDWKSKEEISEDRQFLIRVNSAGFLSDEDHLKLGQLHKKTYKKPCGEVCRLLSDSEYESLSIRKGNLTKREREIINSHATSTYKILSKIPWTKPLENIPLIACHHHEKMDGSGYPNGLAGDQIPLESRILAVIDIYEALVAQDRPYKPKTPPERALKILKAEVENNHLDSEVVNFFIDKKIYKLFPNSDPVPETVLK
ncbi:MAG: HD domain-containing phosphohydrolase [Chitinispirillaceae bacterium]